MCFWQAVRAILPIASRTHAQTHSNVLGIQARENFRRTLNGTEMLLLPPSLPTHLPYSSLCVHVNVGLAFAKLTTASAFKKKSISNIIGCTVTFSIVPALHLEAKETRREKKKPISYFLVNAFSYKSFFMFFFLSLSLFLRRFASSLLAHKNISKTIADKKYRNEYKNK